MEFKEPLVKGKAAFDHLAQLQNEVLRSNEDEILLRIDSPGNRYGRTLLFLVYGLNYLAQAHGKVLHTTFPYNPNMLRHMGQLGVWEEESAENFHTLPMSGKVSARERAAVNASILENMPVHFTEKAKSVMGEIITEIFNNGFEHSGAQHVIAGRYKGQGGKHCFSCYDTGAGIVNKVQNFLGDYNMSDEACLRWALQKGNSTAVSREDPVRGLGLDMNLLKSFVRINKGHIRIGTGRILYMYTGGEEGDFHRLSSPFWGTLFEVACVKDGGTYFIRGEQP